MILKDVYRLLKCCLLTLLMSNIAVAGIFENAENMNIPQEILAEKSYTAGLQRNESVQGLNFLIEITSGQSLTTSDKLQELLIDAGLYAQPNFGLTNDSELNQQPEYGVPDLSEPEILVSLHEQMSLDSMIADWHSFKGQVKANKQILESVFFIDNLPSARYSGHAGNYRANNFANSRPGGATGGNFNKSETESLPAFFRLFYSIFNFPKNHPVIFYSIVFSFAFVVIIKTILVIATSLR